MRTTIRHVIQDHQDEIIRIWTQRTRTAAFAEELPPSELSGMMPGFVGALGGDGTGHLTGDQRGIVEQHLAGRLRQGATLNEILTEFAVLGQVVTGVLGREAERATATVRDVANVLGELNQACVATMKIFNEQLLEDEQPVKRSLRLLHNHMGDARRLTRRRLTDGLSLTTRAVGARSAALLLFHPHHDAPALSVACGDDAESLLEYALSLDAAPLRAERELATKAVAVAVTRAMSDRGLRAVVGVRVPSPVRLRGVMFVGWADRDAVAASEVRQLATLAEALTGHIGRADQLDALHAEAEEAHAEVDLRDHFLALILHDLRGPIAAAKTATGALLLPGAPDRADVVAHVNHELDRLARMVDGLVDAYQVRIGKRLPMEVGPCDLAVLAREVIAEVCASQPNQFVLRLDDDVCGIWSADLLRRAIWNLAMNASTFGSAGAPVFLDVHRRADIAELSVHNEGQTVIGDEQVQLTQPFSAPNGNARFRSGWGLCLAMVWGCAEAHGGRVKISSRRGRGTTMKLQIPFDARPYLD